MSDATKGKQKEQIRKAEEAQDLLLDVYLARLNAGTISDTGLAALQRLLMANGWSLDPNRLPEELKDKLTDTLDADEVEEEDNTIPFPLRNRG